MKELGLLKHTDLVQTVKELWALPEREFQYFAIELMAFHKKVWEQEVIELFEYCIVNKSWWDSVDFICTECVSPYFKKYTPRRKEITNRWNKSDNIWLQRSSLLFQKGYKKDTDTKMLAEYIVHLAGSKEFFVQKAIGWMLREHARVDVEWVREFVASHHLPALSKREALKHL
jgi:3-methyladenine DNA glycosylase AlkD